MPPVVAAHNHTHAISTACRWHLADPSWQESVTQVSKLINAPESIAASQLLKHANRRLVFKHVDPATGQAVVVKAFPLQGLKRRLFKHRKYALAEAIHLQQAGAMGIPVPAMYAYGSQGMVFKQWTAVIMEHVAGRDFLSLLGSASSPEEEEQVLNRCADLLLTLFQAGVNHIDLKPDALVFGNSSNEDRIIDFQYCTFGPPNVKTAIAQAGHFAYWWLQEDPDAQDKVLDWAEMLLTRLCPQSLDLASALGSFNQSRQSVMSISQRLQQ